MDRRRLCMVVHAPYPRAETRVEREAHAAQERGWEVDVVAMREPDELADEVGPDGIRIYRLRSGKNARRDAGKGRARYLGFTLLAMRKVAALHRLTKYSVVQIHNPPDFLILAGLIPRVLRSPVVFDVHDLAPELFELRFAERRAGRFLVLALRIVERLALRFADAVVTVHEPYRRLLIARGVPEHKITVALNSPDERLLPEAAALRRDASFRVVYHGTITHHYGLHTLVEAVARLDDRIPSLVVEIYGAGDALEPVKEKAAALGVSGRFRFSDRFLDNAEVLSRVLGAQVGVIANLAIERNQTALPTKLFEYAALNIPIVSSDLAAVREYFDPDEVGFFRAGDPDSLAEALAAVADDPQGASGQAARARRRYRAYRWSVCAREYVETLEALAETTRSP